jgi:hypothetical protein
MTLRRQRRKRIRHNRNRRAWRYEGSTFLARWDQIHPRPVWRQVGKRELEKTL